MDRVIELNGVPVVGIDIKANKAYIQTDYWALDVKQAITSTYGITYFVLVDCIPQVTTITN